MVGAGREGRRKVRKRREADNDINIYLSIHSSYIYIKIDDYTDRQTNR